MQAFTLKAFFDSEAAGNFMDLDLDLQVPLTNLDDPLTITALVGRPLGSGQVSLSTFPVLSGLGVTKKLYSFM